MRSQLRFLTFAALAGCAVYVIAQVAAPVRGGQSGAGGIVATKDGRKYQAKTGRRAAEPQQPANALQLALQIYMISKQTYLQTLAESEGRRDRIDPIIETHCYWRLTTMRPDQQQAEIHNVWQIDVWAPNHRWKEIAKAPSLVNALLQVTPALESKVEAIQAANPNKMIQASNALTKRLYGDPKFKALPKEKQYEIVTAETKKLQAGRTVAQLQLEALRTEETIVNAIEKILSPAQRQEWNKIKSQYDRAVMDAYRGEAGNKTR